MTRARLSDVSRLRREVVGIVSLISQTVALAAPLQVRRRAIIPWLRLATKKQGAYESLITPPVRERRTLNDHHVRLGGARFVDEFRFNFTEIPDLMALLEMPETFRLRGRARLTGEDILGIILHRLSYPITLTREADFWGLDEQTVCDYYNWGITHIYERLFYISKFCLKL